MGQTVYKIPRANDNQINDHLIAIGREFGEYNVNIYIGDINAGQVTYPDASSENIKSILAMKSELITSISGNINGISFWYYRGGNNGHQWEKSPIFDDIAIDIQSFESFKIEISSRILELFKPTQLPKPSEPIALLEAQRALQESSFLRLQKQLEEVFQQTINLRSQLDEQVRNKELELQEQFKQKQTDASNEIQAEKNALAKLKEELDERSKSIDESDNTFARRQIRNSMLNDVSDRVKNFGLSDATIQARRPVAAGMFLLGSFLFFLLAWTILEIHTIRTELTSDTKYGIAATITNKATASFPSQPKQSELLPNSSMLPNEQSSNAEIIILWVRFGLISISLAATILYYIRWQNQLATSFASTEENLKQFHIDVNRANWVVETCLEWRKETDSEIPSHLIESLTRGLFSGKDTTPAVLHPADELASALMGSASKLSLDLNGNKLEIDKPGKIPKSIASSGSANKSQE